VWNAESSRSREHVLHCDADAPTSKGTFKGVWQIEKYSNAQDLGLCKRVSCAKKRTDLNDLYVV